MHVDDAGALGRRLREARQRAGLKQRDLAFPGCTMTYISRLEAGQRTPSLQVIRELARRLGVTEQWLATGAEGAGSEESPKLLEADLALRLDEKETAARLYGELLEEAVDAEDRARALAGLGQLAFRDGDLRRAVQHLEEALSLARGTLADYPAAVDTLGRAYSFLGDLDAAISLYRRCLAEVEERGDHAETVRFSVLLTFALEDRGAFDEAAELLQRTAPLVEESNDPLLRARIYWSQSRLHTLKNEPRLAASYARKALEIVELSEHSYYTGRAHQLLAHAEIDRGRPEEALEIVERGWGFIAETASPLEQAQFRLEEARALAALGRGEEAASLAMQISALVADSDPVDAARAYAVLADVFRELGETARARELYELAAELLEKNPNRYLIEVYARLADLLEAEGRNDEALEKLKRAVRVRYEPRALPDMRDY